MHHLPIINRLQNFNDSLSCVLDKLMDTVNMINHSNNPSLSKYFAIYVIGLVCIFIASASWASKHEVLSPLPTVVEENWSGFELVGQTKLKRFGFHIYDSSFWMINKQNPAAQLDSATCALSITYARKIRVQQLLSSTKKEWLRLGFAEQYPLDRWLIMLSNIWTDVDKGDQLVVVSDTNGTSSFYNKDQRLGVIDDAQFGSAFLSIWLNENSRFKKNRQELLGE